jgi:hypothetical protein
VSLTAPTGLTGAYAAYNGLTIFQDPASANPVTVTGQGSLTMTGTLYAPQALLKIDGNGNAVVSAFSAGQLSLGGVVVAFDAMVTGNGALTINADPPPSAASAAATTAAPSSAGAGIVPFAVLGASTSSGGSVPGEDELLRQTSLLLTGGQQADGNSPSPAPVTQSVESTTGANQTALAQLFSSTSGGTGAAVSGDSKGVPPDRSIAAWVDPLSEHLADELFSSSVPVA